MASETVSHPPDVPLYLRPRTSLRLSQNAEKWESLRDEIHYLYIVENKSLAQTMQEISKKHEFAAA